MSAAGLGPRLRAVTRIRNILTAAVVPLIPGSACANTGQVADAMVWGLTCGLVVALLAALIFWRRMRAAETAADAARAEAAQSAEKARHSNAEKTSLTAVLDALPIPVWRRDGELTLVDCKTAYSELLERTRDDIKRSTHAIAVFPVEGPSSTAARTRAIG